MLLAGRAKHVHALMEKQMNVGGGRVKAFDGILSTELNTTQHKLIYDRQKRPILPHAQVWKEEAESLAEDYICNGIVTRLSGKAPAQTMPDSIVCYVWRITRPTGAGSEPIDTIFGQAE